MLRRKIFRIRYLLIALIVFTAFAGCGKAEDARKDDAGNKIEDGKKDGIKLTAENTYEAVSNYCKKFFEWSPEGADPSTEVYLAKGDETDTEFNFTFRSYTGSFTDFHVNKATGETRVVERVPIVGIEEEKDPINIFDYIEK